MMCIDILFSSKSWADNILDRYCTPSKLPWRCVSQGQLASTRKNCTTVPPALKFSEQEGLSSDNNRTGSDSCKFKDCQYCGILLAHIPCKKCRQMKTICFPAPLPFKFVSKMKLYLRATFCFPQSGCGIWSLRYTWVPQASKCKYHLQTLEELQEHPTGGQRQLHSWVFTFCPSRRQRDWKGQRKSTKDGDTGPAHHHVFTAGCGVVLPAHPKEDILCSHTLFEQNLVPEKEK